MEIDEQPDGTKWLHAVLCDAGCHRLTTTVTRTTGHQLCGETIKGMHSLSMLDISGIHQSNIYQIVCQYTCN